MPLNRWSTLASFHRTMILHGCRLSLPVVAGGASIDAGLGVCGLCGRAAPRVVIFLSFLSMAVIYNQQIIYDPGHKHACCLGTKAATAS